MLNGIRIIEIEGLGPAPFAGMMLADLGAEVIVVHRDRPDTASSDRSLLNRGKKSIVLNLKSTRDVDVVKQLVADSDGLIEGFRPGVMERLGLGPEILQEINPRLVFGRVTGWGQTGPNAQMAGHDLNYLALSGALWYASKQGEPPSVPPAMLGDIGGGALYLVIGMLAALLRAQREGKGAVVDAAIVDGSAHMMNLMMAAQTSGFLTADRGNSVLDGSPWSRCYRTSDDGWLSVQCLEPQFYDIFLQTLNVDSGAFKRHQDASTWTDLGEQIEKIIASKSLNEWCETFADCDACVAPVLSPSEAALDKHLSARGVWTQVDGQLQACSAPRFDGQLPPKPRAMPTHGEHTEEILASLDARRKTGHS